LIYPDEPLTVLQMGLMRQKGSRAGYDGKLESLKDRTIGRIRNARVAPAFDEAAANGLFHLEERSDFGLLALAVAHGRVDFLAGDELMGLWGAAENGVLDRVEMVHPHFGDNPVYLAISKKSPFASRVDEISAKLTEIKKSQNFKRALESYGKFLKKDVFDYLLKVSAD